MARRQFDVGDYDIEIYRHPDGSLTIEASAEYGDSEIGLGSITKTIKLDPERAREFAAFILSD